MPTITRVRGDRLRIRNCVRQVTVEPTTEGIQFVDVANLNTFRTGSSINDMGGLEIGLVRQGADVYLMGGANSVGVSAVTLNRLDKRTTPTGPTTALANMPADRAGGAVGIFGDTIFYLGGFQLSSGIPQHRTTIYSYSISGNSWSTLGATVPFNTGTVKSVVFDNKIYMVFVSFGGGGGPRRLASFDPTDSSFEILIDGIPGDQELLTECPFGEPVVFADRIYFLQGRSQVMHRFDPVTENLDTINGLYSLAYENPACSLIGGRYYVAAGGHLYPGSGGWGSSQRSGVSIIDLVSQEEVSASLTLKVSDQLHGLRGITVGDVCYLFGGAQTLTLPVTQDEIQAVAEGDPFT